MSRRDEVWTAFLGREPNSVEFSDIAMVADTLSLGDNDPFWGVIALIYSRLPKTEAQQRAEHERFRAIRDLADEVMLKVDALDALEDRTLAAVRAALAEWLPRTASLEGSLGDAAARPLERAKFNTASRLSHEKVWSARGTTVGYLAGGCFLAVGLLIIAAFRWGLHEADQRHAAVDVITQTQAHRIADWARTRDGRRIYAWAVLNGAGLNPVLQCDFGAPAKLIYRNGTAICYPAGRGNGYYVVGR
ncbi:MAG: hypothetical protein ACLPXB_13475 [Thiobacillaceae bacterium]